MRIDKHVKNVIHIHNKIKEITGTQTNKFWNILKHDWSYMIGGLREKLLQWTKYINYLFDDDRGELSLQVTEDTGTPILR